MVENCHLFYTIKKYKISETMNKGYFYIILTTFIISTMEIAAKLIITSLIIIS
jgi:hypothetical protein